MVTRQNQRVNDLISSEIDASVPVKSNLHKPALKSNSGLHQESDFITVLLTSPTRLFSLASLQTIYFQSLRQKARNHQK
jgi:hypothetical protein